MVERNPVNSPVEVGSWNPTIYEWFYSWYEEYPVIYMILYIPGGFLAGFLNHQQYFWIFHPFQWLED